MKLISLPGVMRILAYSVILSICAISANAQSYCLPSSGLIGGCANGDYPVQFSLTGTSTSINDPVITCTGGYDDRTAETCTVGSPSTVSGTITANPYSSSSTTGGGSGSGSSSSTTTYFPAVQNMAIWVDWNNDFTFDVSEMVGGLSSISASSPTPFTITVPTGITSGSYRMRMVVTSTTIATYSPGSSSFDPCMMTTVPLFGSLPYSSGDALDYTIIVGPTCPPPTALTLGASTTTSEVVSWTAATGASGYQYVVDNNSASPTGSGIAVSTTTFTATGLTASTTYYAHVRTDCGGGSYSVWVTIPFTTPSAPPCNPPTGLTSVTTTSNTETFTWTPASGAVGSQYVVNTTGTTPTGSGTTATSPATASGLTPSTVYHLYVRDSCGPGSVSSWVTITFTTTATAPCNPPTGLATSGGSSTTETFTWNTASGTVSSQYVVSTTAGIPTGSGTIGTSPTTATGLTPSTFYYVYVRDSCGPGSVSTWVVDTFTTPATPVVCNPPSGLGISGVTTTSGTFTWTPASGTAASEYVVSTTAGTPTGSGTVGTSPTTDGGLTPGTVYYVYIRDSCGPGSVSSWVTETFTTTSTPTTCAPPVPSVSSFSTTSATVSWPPVAGSSGYDWAVNTTGVAPTGSGSSTSASSFTDNSLTSGTNYYGWVRDSCGPGNYSVWVEIPFATNSTCGLPSPTVTAVTSTSGTVHWSSISGALRYIWIVNTSSLAPASDAGATITTSTNFTKTGLIPNTNYWAHVRDSCGASSKSAWATVPFRTWWASGVSTQVATDFDITAYPNPVKDELTVEVNGMLNGEAQIQLIDVTGKLIKTVAVSSNKTNVGMSGLSSGVYLIRYIDAGHTQTIKVSKD